MPADCELWLDEKTEIGRHTFDQLPRPGDNVSVSVADGGSYRHFHVDGVTHRAAGETLKAATYLFVSEVEKEPAVKSGSRANRTGR